MKLRRLAQATRATSIMALLHMLFVSECSAASPTCEEARVAILRAVALFRSEVAMDGGYLWRYSADLKKREGEGKVTTRKIWVQPPGTPAVGMAMLRAWELTGETPCLKGAIEAAQALIHGQLHSGGWSHSIELEPDARRRHAYRVDGTPGKKARNVSTLDDNSTQAAALLMIRVDQALRFKDAAIHEAAEIALNAILKYQFESGGWSQGFGPELEGVRCPARKASFPDEWSRTYQGHQNYWYKPTFNDGLMSDLLPVLLEASEIYDEPRYREAALRGGEFLLLAQLPNPQPGWAQQYSYEMQPIWARKFEPPAITGSESRGVIRVLMRLFRETGNHKWLEPVPRALAYYKKSELPGGRLARFYELETNRPLYFTKDYKLTYDGRNVPTHYSFSSGSWVNSLTRELERTRRMDEAARLASLKKGLPSCSASQARRLIASMDERGAWVDEERLRYFGKADPTTHIIDCATFVKNLPRLAAYAGKAE